MPDCRVVFPKNDSRRGEMFNAMLVAFLNDPTLKPTPRKAGICESVIDALLNTRGDMPTNDEHWRYSGMALEDLRVLVAEKRITWHNRIVPSVIASEPNLVETVLKKSDGTTMTIASRSERGEIAVCCEGIPHGHALAVLGAAVQFFAWKNLTDEPYVNLLAEIEARLKGVIADMSMED